MSNENESKSLISSQRKWELLFLLLILVSGLGVRLIDLKDPPLDFAATRQLRSALIARGKYYQWNQDAPEWKREVAIKQGAHSMIEPTIMETLTAAGYWILGREAVWLARVLSAVFWTLGGAVLYFLAREMVSINGAMIALAYYMFNPFGIAASRSFQPDPLMSALIVAAWWTFYRWYKESSWKWTIWSGLAAGAAMLVKSTAVFFLLGGMAVLVLLKKDIRRTIKDFQVWVIALMAGVPVLAYHLYGVLVVGTLGQQFQGRFFPEMLTTADYYQSLMNAMSRVAGHEVLLLLGVLGLLYFRKRREFGYLTGIWLGYALYVIGFTYHSTTHYYYHLPAIPLIAISLAGEAEWFFRRTKKLRTVRWLPLGLLIVVGLGLLGGNYLLKKDDYRHEPHFYQKVAGFVPRETKIIVLSQDYGNRIAYYGWISPRPWKSPPSSAIDDPYPEDLENFSQYFEDYTAGFDYFIITRLRNFRSRDYLAAYLQDNYPVHREGGGYLIFSLSEQTDS
jgi:4-amino-4-deoxy-L-arabinose transferase-like glycosyltransferase